MDPLCNAVELSMSLALTSTPCLINNLTNLIWPKESEVIRFIHLLLVCDGPNTDDNDEA